MKEIILILLLQLAYVPLYTLRTIFLVKNITMLAALIGIVEMLIYVFGLSLVFSGDQGFLAMVVYAVGFGIGIIIGTWIILTGTIFDLSGYYRGFYMILL